MAASTVISQTTFVRGRVSGSGDLEISGRIEGEVVASGGVTIEASALLAANVSAARIVVRGAVKGDLVAEETLVVEAGARVVGDLRAPRLTIAPGALVRGHVETSSNGARPRATAAVATARAPEAKARTAAPPSRAPVSTAAPISKAAPPPPVSIKTHNGQKPESRTAPTVSSRPSGPPLPVVPVLKKGTKAVQKKRGA